MPHRPPRLAVWLVDAFAPHTRAEAIRGDLQEEFSELASQAGTRAARRWYWRQSVTTAAHLFADGFRTAPASIAGSLLAGWLTSVYGNAAFTWLSYRAVVALLTRYPVYHYINAHLFWQIYPDILQGLTISLLMGAVAAAIAKDREMVAAITLSLLSGTFRGANFLWFAWYVLPHLPPYVRIIQPSLPYVLLQHVIIDSILMAAGAGAIRKLRSFAKTRSDNVQPV
jgi:hypothetical protein